MVSHVSSKTMQILGSPSSRGELNTKVGLDQPAAIKSLSAKSQAGALTANPGIKVPIHIEKLRMEPANSVGTAGGEVVSAIYSNLKKVKKFTGYKIDANSRPILNSEQWEDVMVPEVIKGLKPGIYKLETFSPIDAGVKGISDPGKIPARESFIEIKGGI